MPDRPPSVEQAPSGPSLAFEPRAGDLFANRYRIETLLGRGMTGAVWAALDEGVGDRVALKLLGAEADDATERFRREVRLARRVTHKNAARIFDLGIADSVLYLTMELVDGESLERRLSRESPLEVLAAAQIGEQVASGLAAAHEVGVIHRDIKPANVLLETSGRVVLTDFGVARAMSGDANVTIGAAMIGTPSYMAPEQVRGKAIGPAADLYALGAMLYEMLTGRCPFIEEGVVATALARLERDPEDPRLLAPIPDGLATLVLDLLARSPEQRPTSATEVSTSLARIATESKSPASAATLLAVPGASTRLPAPSSERTATTASSTTGEANRASSSTFVSIAPEERTLAVLPFRHRGREEHSHLADSLAEDLVDVLTTTRGLRVTAGGATAKYQGRMVDPREAGRELNVDAIVDGSVRATRRGARISARLIDVATGEQLWFDRFDHELSPDEELDETLAQRMAENLRLELELLSARHRVSAEAVELLLEARQRSQVPSQNVNHFDVAMELVERALAIAPDFALAKATHADYAARRWFLPSAGTDQDVAKRAHDSVARACAEAPQIPLTHFAAGRLAVSDGRFGDAASELSLALAMAPTFAAVHDYLGMLQCEAGRGDEGERHILLARRIDPTIAVGQALARRYALVGDLDAYARTISEMKADPAASRFMVETLEMRVAGWFGDLDTVRRCRPSAHISPEHNYYRFLAAQQAGLLREGTSEELLQALEAVLGSGFGPRLVAFIHQLALEALLPLGDLDGALEELRIAVELPAFVDTDWMERCPALDPLRGHTDFEALTAKVRLRAGAIWRVRATA